MRHKNRDIWLEFDQTYHPYRQAVVKKPFVQKDGLVSVPDGPGLGVAVDRKALADFTVETRAV